jgi:hypothetical protein
MYDMYVMSRFLCTIMFMPLNESMYDYVKYMYKSWLGQVKIVMPKTFLGFPNRPA